MSTFRFKTAISVRGEEVDVYRRTESGTDEYNRPTYSWSKIGTEKMLIEDLVSRGQRVPVEFIEAGKIDEADRYAFAPSNTTIQEFDRIETGEGKKYEVRLIRAAVFEDTIEYYECFLKEVKD